MFTLVFVGLGILCLVIGVVMFRSSKKLSREGVAADGVITRVDLDRSRTGDGEMTSYLPVFEFKSSDGVTHAVKSNRGSNSSKAFKVGQPVPVLYLPTQPEKAQINKAGLMWAAPVVFCVLGVALLGASVVLAHVR
ncbi:MAG: DUF3592 domain-containing protein [Acidobacteriota bacterium]